MCYIYLNRYSPVIRPKMKNVESRFMSEKCRASCRNKHRYVCRTKSATTEHQKSTSIRFARQTINERNNVFDDEPIYFQWRFTNLVTNNSIGQMDTVSPNYGAKRLRSEKTKLPTDRQRLVPTQIFGRTNIQIKYNCTTFFVFIVG